MPIFSYGLGYRMCTGYTLANRELYILMARLIALFEIDSSPDTDANHISGCVNPAHLTMAPKDTGLYFRPRDPNQIKHILGQGVI